MTKFLEKKILHTFKGQSSITRIELLDFYRSYEPDLKESTFAWRIHDLKQKNILQTIGLSLYTLAQKPEVLLLDEPFSHIDNFRKNSLRRNLFNYLKQEKITCLTATHDHNDILPFADRVLVLKDRQILAEEPIEELYKSPRNLYIASLFGEANLVPINIIKSYADTKRKIIVYAHEFKVSRNSGLPVVVKKTYPMGSHYLVEGLTDEQIIYFHSERNIEIETEVFLNISLETINQRLKL